MLSIVTSTDMLIRQLMFVDMVIGFMIVVSILIGVYFMSVLSDGLKGVTDKLTVLNGTISSAVTQVQSGGATQFTQADLDMVSALDAGVKAANNQLAPLVGGQVIP